MSAVTAERLPQERSPENSHRPPWLLRGRVPCLDGLRGISIILVLLSHGAKTHGFHASRIIREAAGHGRVGVDVFFAISGFLITLLLLRERQRTGTLSLKGFYTRRALRILPAYLTFVLVLFGLTRVGLAQIRPQDWAGVLTYTVNFVRDQSWAVGHVWSLSIEEQFYLVWPLLLLLMGPKRARTAVFGYLIAAPLVRGYLWAQCPGWLTVAGDWRLERLDSIAAGCLLALLAMEPEFCRRTRWPGRKAFWIGALAVMVLIASRVMGDNRLPTYVLSYSLTAVSIAVLLWLCTNHEEGPVGRFLQSRPLAAVGTLSYSLYLWQQLFLNPQSDRWPCHWPINLCGALLVAWLSYRFIESPFLRLKEKRAQGEPEPVRTRRLSLCDEPASPAIEATV